MTAPDVLVVGGGIAGASVAWHLAPHASVLVLEQGTEPATQASAQNAGIVRLLGEDPLERALARRTQALLEDPPDTWDPAISRRTGGLLALNRDPHALHDAAAHLRATGVRVDPCDRPGSVAPAMVGSPVRFAWHLPDARVVDAPALSRALFADLGHSGGALRCGVKVTDIRIEAGRVCGVETDSGPIDAGAVVLATAAWSPHLARLLGVERPFVPLVRSAFASGPHGAATADHPWCWVDDEGIYIRALDGGWLACPCDEAVAPPPETLDSWGQPASARADLTRSRLARFFPALGTLDLARGWTGLRTFAPDRRPVLGPDPDLQGLWWAASLGGFGVTGSIGVGEAVAQWMRGEPTPWLDRPRVAPGRATLRRWPIYPEGVHGQARLVDAP